MGGISLKGFFSADTLYVVVWCAFPPKAINFNLTEAEKWFTLLLNPKNLL